MLSSSALAATLILSHGTFCKRGRVQRRFYSLFGLGCRAVQLNVEYHTPHLPHNLSRNQREPHLEADVKRCEECRWLVKANIYRHAGRRIPELAYRHSRLQDWLNALCKDSRSPSWPLRAATSSRRTRRYGAVELAEEPNKELCQEKMPQQRQQHICREISNSTRLSCSVKTCS